MLCSFKESDSISKIDRANPQCNGHTCTNALQDLYPMKSCTVTRPKAYASTADSLTKLAGDRCRRNFSQHSLQFFSDVPFFRCVWCWVEYTKSSRMLDYFWISTFIIPGPLHLSFPNCSVICDSLHPSGCVHPRPYTPPRTTVFCTELSSSWFLSLPVCVIPFAH